MRRRGSRAPVRSTLRGCQVLIPLPLMLPFNSMDREGHEGTTGTMHCSFICHPERRAASARDLPAGLVGISTGTGEGPSRRLRRTRDDRGGAIHRDRHAPVALVLPALAEHGQARTLDPDYMRGAY